MMTFFEFILLTENVEPLFHDTYTGKRYKYGMNYRPIQHGSIPDGYIIHSESSHRDFQFGTIDYPRVLSSNEEKNFQLTPLDPNHPINLKKARDMRLKKARDIIGEREVFQMSHPDMGEVIVAPSTRNIGKIQATHLKDGRPTGHDEFDYIDDALKELSGLGFTVK